MNKDDLMKFIGGILGLIGIIGGSALAGASFGMCYNGLSDKNTPTKQEKTTKKQQQDKTTNKEEKQNNSTTTKTVDIHILKDTEHIYPSLAEKIIMKDCFYRQEIGVFHEDVDCRHLTNQVMLEVYTGGDWPTVEKFQEIMSDATNKFQKKWSKNNPSVLN